MTKYSIILLLILILALTTPVQPNSGQDSLQKGIDSIKHNNYELAEHCFVDSYKSAIKEGNSEVMTLSLSMLGDLHAFFSSFASAKRFYLKAQDCAEGDRKLQASLFFSLGSLEWMAGNFKDSLRYFEKVNKETDDSVSPLTRVRALLFEGSSFTNLKNYNRAESCLARALRILERNDNAYLASFCNMLLGDVYRERSETQRALTCYRIALEEARKHLADDHYLHSQIYYRMGVFFEGLSGSEPDIDASSCYQKSFDAMMCIDGHLTLREKIQVPHTNVESGKKLTAILLEEGKEEEALQMCQRSKEWDYIEQNRSMLAFRTLAEDSPKLALALQVQEISEQKAAEARTTIRNAAREELRKAVQQSGDEYRKTAAELLETSPWIGSLLLPVNITVQDLLYSLSQDDGFVEFCAVDNHIYGWYVDLTEFKAWELPKKTAEVLMASGRNGGESDSAKENTAYRTPAQMDVFGPAASLITGKKRIIISPDMPFFTFPFASLRDDAGSPLAESRQVQLCLSSSLWTLRTMKRHSTRKPFLLCTLGEKGPENCRQIEDKQLLNYSRSQIMPDESPVAPISFSDSSLADLEALHFFPLFSPRVAIRDSEAVQIRLDEALKDASVIHFSTYGSFHSEIPLLSGAGLYDSVLSARNLYTVKLPPAHAVLSLYASRGHDRGNRGLYSAARALIFAGARSVMVNTRKPDRDIHLSLLTDYYNAVRSGLREGEAFMMAQQRSMEKYPGNNYWASILFMGRRYDDN